MNDELKYSMNSQPWVQVLYAHILLSESWKSISCGLFHMLTAYMKIFGTRSTADSIYLNSSDFLELGEPQHLTDKILPYLSLARQDIKMKNIRKQMGTIGVFGVQTRWKR